MFPTFIYYYYFNLSTKMYLCTKYENTITWGVIKMSRETIKSCGFKTPIEKHETASWANISKTKSVSKVTIPSNTETRNAKDWVDINEK